MGDAENVLPPSKKRVAGRQLSRDEDPDAEEEVSGQETGTFQRASNEVLATRRIVRVRRNQPSPSPAPNPFAAIRLVPPTAPASVVGEYVSKPPETAVVTGLAGLPSVSQQGEAFKVSDDTGRSTSTNGAVKVSETELSEVTVKEDEKVKVEAQFTAAEIAEKNGDAKKESPGGPPDTEIENSKETSQEITKDEQVNEDLTKEEHAKEELQSDKPKQETSRDEQVNADPTKKEHAKEELQSDKSKQETSKDEQVNGDPTKEEHAKEELQIDKPKQETSTTVNSFQQLSSTQNAFIGISGTGFSSSTFSFGLTSKLGTFSTGASFGSAFSSGSFSSTGSLFGAKLSNDGASPSSTSNGSASVKLFGVQATDNNSISGSGLSALHEVPLETGEERERSVFTADATLFEYISGGWKERGKGELKVNVSNTDTEKARLVMRSKGNYRLILNANLYPDMKLTNMDKRGITFPCMNSAGDAKEGLATFALKFKDSSVVYEFRGAVEAHKGTSSGTLKTPENSPKASED